MAQINEGEKVADAAVKENKAMASVGEIPGLPRVLIIGDSISIGYTLPTRDLLKGRANVTRIPVNGQASSPTSKVKTWLGTGKWDVVHVNFGLWDAKMKGDQPTTDLATYEKNLREVVAIIKASGAKIVWATTTPVPEVLKPEGRRFAPIPTYNEVAIKVMKEEGVAIDDLYAVMQPNQAKYQNPLDVHYSPAGSKLLAAAVAKSIEAELPTPQPKP